MFCSHCGKPLSSDEKFCPSCGKLAVASGAVGSSFPKKYPAGGKKPVLVIKPKYVFLLNIFSAIRSAIFWGIWGGLFLGGFMAVFVGGRVEVDASAVRMMALFAIGFFFFGLILKIVPKILTYSKTKYYFYSDRMEYSEGFFTVEEKTIGYDRVTEISLNKGALQKKFGLGGIYLSTAAEGKSSGLYLSDIESPDEVYRKLKELIGV